MTWRREKRAGERGGPPCEQQLAFHTAHTCAMQLLVSRLETIQQETGEGQKAQAAVKGGDGEL